MKKEGTQVPIPGLSAQVDVEWSRDESGRTIEVSAKFEPIDDEGEIIDWDYPRELLWTLPEQAERRRR
jgi:hypothetical protein